jgi:hypothetical protein
MKHVRSYALLAIVVALVVLILVLGHGVRVRLIWGSSGFVAGVICGVLLAAEIHHRRKRRSQRG